MSNSWLANADPATAWAHFPWSAFGPGAAGAHTLAVLPVHGLADHGLGLPLDAEEVVGSAVLRRAVTALGSGVPLRVLPPLRFALAPYPSTFFGIDPETAHELIQAIARSVQAAGIDRLIFFNTSPWNAELLEAAALDARASVGLHTYVIHLPGVGLDFHPAREGRAQAQAVAVQLLGRPPETPTRPADIHDTDFRPGQYRQPPPLPFTGTVDGTAALAFASAQLARLIAEVAARALPGANAAAATAPAVPAPVTAPAEEMHWPAYRARYLGSLTREALEALPNKESALVILPTGAIEQHGHHLPVGVDAILGQSRLHHALRLLPGDSPVYVAPPLTYGKSTEHVDFPGTVSLSGQTLRRLVLAVAEQLRALGFRQLAILNTHGGNSAVLVYTLRELQNGREFRAGMLSGYYTPEQTLPEATYGFHGGEWETSLMLACCPAWVRMDRAVCEYPPLPSESELFRPGNAPAVYAWLTGDLSVSGVIGDATLGSTEKGIRWMTESSLSLADSMERHLPGD